MIQNDEARATSSTATKQDTLISIALLARRLSLSKLAALYQALEGRFAYFEIVLLNPQLESSEEFSRESSPNPSLDFPPPPASLVR